MHNVLWILETYPDAGSTTEHDDDIYDQPHGEIVSCFKHFSEDFILEPFVSQDDFRTNS